MDGMLGFTTPIKAPRANNHTHEITVPAYVCQKQLLIADFGRYLV
jgi:hypothetical protein